MVIFCVVNMPTRVFTPSFTSPSRTVILRRLCVSQTFDRAVLHDTCTEDNDDVVLALIAAGADVHALDVRLSPRVPALSSSHRLVT
jgi:hypothetical protein